MKGKNRLYQTLSKITTEKARTCRLQVKNVLGEDVHTRGSHGLGWTPRKAPLSQLLRLAACCRCSVPHLACYSLNSLACLPVRSGQDLLLVPLLFVRGFTVCKPIFWLLCLFPLGLRLLISTFYSSISLSSLASPVLPSHSLWLDSGPTLIPSQPVLSHPTSTFEFLFLKKFLDYTYSCMHGWHIQPIYEACPCLHFIKILNVL